MAEHLPADQPGNESLEAIRRICEEQTFFDEIEFEPYGSETGALSVVGSSELPALGGEIALTLWRGSKDGRPSPVREADPLWLRLEGGTDSGDSFVELSAVDPGAEALGLTLPDFLLTPLLLDSCRALLNLLDAAEATDEGLTGEARERNFGELDDAVQDGFDAADSADYMADGDDDAPKDLVLHGQCENSPFVTIAFGQHDNGSLATRAVLPTVAGDVPLALWLDTDDDHPEPFLMLDLKGRVQKLPPDFMNRGLDAPWEQGMALTQVKMGLQRLLTIHAVALELSEEHPEVDSNQLCAALTMLATNALKEGDPLPLEIYLSGAEEVDEGPEWHQAMDEFTEHCKLGFMAGVVVEESLHGNLNIRAVTIDPVTRDYVPLQVFWQEPDDGGEAEHWLSVGKTAAPAHTEDEDEAEAGSRLLAGFPQTSKEYIGHAIGHLHEMVHLATDVVNGKTGEVAAALEIANERRPVADAVGGHMMDEAVEDALMGLNGVARLYTGSVDRDVRNS